MRVLVHHDGALGDVLLSLPLLGALHDASDLLHFTGRPDLGCLLFQCGLVHETSSAGSPFYAPLHAGRADGPLAAFLAGFDHAWLFTVNSDSAAAAALANKLPTTVIATVPPAASSVHVRDYRRSQFPGALPLADRVLPVPGSCRAAAAEMLENGGREPFQPVVAVHPGSGSADKCWPPDRFFQVVDRLLTDGCFVALLTGPAEERGLEQQVREYAGDRAGVTVWRQELIGAAALLGQADLFIGNDSGTAHLAAAAGCPVLVLFGPTDPGRWRPRGRLVEVLRERTLAEIDADRVYFRAAAMLRNESGRSR